MSSSRNLVVVIVIVINSNNKMVVVAVKLHSYERLAYYMESWFLSLSLVVWTC